MKHLTGAGWMHRNGHAACGACRATEDRTAGGKQTQRERGWRYMVAPGLGWLCPPCVLWAARWELERSPLVHDKVLVAATPLPPVVRGFGFREVGSLFDLPEPPRKGARRRRAAARKLLLGAARAP